MGRYAERTDVPVAKSKADIEMILERYGATGFIYGVVENKAIVGFAMENRQIRFLLPLPRENDYSSDTKFKQANRQCWRALLLVIKAKLESVESGIETFDDAFLSHIVLPDGQLVGQIMRPQIESAYQTGDMPPLLPDFSGGK